MAKNLISGAGLKVGRITYSDGAPYGKVRSQNPPPGTKVRAGSAIDIVLGRKPVPVARVQVPNIVGMIVERAKEVIIDVGLSPGKVTRQTTKAPGVRDGQVLSQTPRAGELVARGTSISITIARKKKAKPAPSDEGDVIVMPPVMFRGEADARKIIEAAGLKVGKILRVPGVPRKRVVYQNPPPGVPVKKGTKVTLHIAN
jgi:serine/threonine-protein kinase